MASSKLKRLVLLGAAGVRSKSHPCSKKHLCKSRLRAECRSGDLESLGQSRPSIKYPGQAFDAQASDMID